MSAKTYDKKTAAFIGFLIQNIPANLTDEVMQGWMSNPDAMKRFLAGLGPQEQEIPLEETPPAKPVSLFSVIATTNLGAIAGKKTKGCFTGSRWAYRDGDFDNWLPKNQSSTEPCVISTLGFSKGWVFAEAARAVLGVIETDTKHLGNLLIEHGHTMTCTQAEEMVEATEHGGEKTEMRTDGYANFFFVETGDPNNPVSVGHVYRDGRDWNASVYSLGHGLRWGADDRLLLRNLSDASTLGS